MRGSGPVATDTIIRVLEETDLVALVAERVELRPRSGRLFGCCPFHEETYPSFTILPHGRRYFCHGCGASGDAIAWLVETGQAPDFRAAVAELARRAGISHLTSAAAAQAPAPARTSGARRERHEAPVDLSAWKKALERAERAGSAERVRAIAPYVR